MGWRDFKNPHRVENRENREFVHQVTEQKPQKPQNPTIPESEIPLPLEAGYVFTDLLTEVEQEIYEDALEVAQSKFGHDKKTAEGVAGRYVIKHCRPLQAQQAAKDFKRYGYIKIFSSVLGGQVYLIKHKGVAGRVPDRSLPVYTPEDIEAVKGLSPEDTLAILEGMMIFGGSIAN